jgi:hypothetical protein
MSVLVPIISVLVLVACAITYPAVQRFDRRVGDRREAQGKPRSVVPKWVVLLASLVLIVGGIGVFFLH